MNAEPDQNLMDEEGETSGRVRRTATSNGHYAQKAPSRADHIKAHQVQPGQVLNPHGRPKGSRNRLSEKFLESLEQLWEERGREILDRAVEESPATLIAAITKLVPKDAELRISGGIHCDLTFEQRQRIATAWMLSQKATPASEAAVEPEPVDAPTLPKTVLEPVSVRRV
jgi:hypothetical protein